MIQGINVLNPVKVEKDYLLSAVDFAIKNKINHIQINGPIHMPDVGNIDGMTIYRKYSQFNEEKDIEYIRKTEDAINEAGKIASANGVKMYVWHHELEVPASFSEKYPEILNSFGDVEITHPVIKDFIENKIEDFFYAYPLVDGIILTLHETRIPLLKLHNQKLGKIERVKYVTELLYNTCKKLGKELIVRPFASIEEDYSMMMQAYEEISADMKVMDKWTQFDWSLCLPHNKFFHKIKKNPLLVETDLFGEFFGKGKLPLMLKQHIVEKVKYCNDFNISGYVSRIDRGGNTSFGDVNEVNIYIMLAAMRNKSVDDAIESFFKNKYPNAYKDVLSLMEKTEDILKKIIYLKGYYFSELSAFPKLNHSKNHFYFEIMKNDYNIASNEWFVPKNWVRGSIDSIIKEKEEALNEAEILLSKLCQLSDKIDKTEFEKLLIKFKNLKYVASVWFELTKIFLNYTRYFETFDESYEKEFKSAKERILKLDEEGKKELGNSFYCKPLENNRGDTDLIELFLKEVTFSFEIEKKKTLEFKANNYTDFVICGGACEGHKIQKEVNFSDTFVTENEIYRIPGNGRGQAWSMVNTHGWFSYKIKIKPDITNRILLTLASFTDMLNLKVTIGSEEHIISKKINGKTEIELLYESKKESYVRIRFDRIDKDVPYIYDIRVL